jgi:glucosamine--fructose-6-phosphate aminotransferase (isomerizing)
MTSMMLSETRETPGLVEAALREDADLYAALGRALRERPPAFAATVARGSSDHAASYAASLFGMLAGTVTASLLPSLITRYDAKPDLSRALVLALSQGGASPDLVKVMTVARAAGAMSIAVVNTAESSLAAAAQWVLPQHAGPERAIPATKSFILTLVAVARLTAAWTGDAVLTSALSRLPDRLEAALTLDWSCGLTVFSQCEATGAYIVGRGLGLATAQEAALKLKETSNLHAEAVSAAEFQHGARALADGNFPVLAFGLCDPEGADVRALAMEMAVAGVPVLLATSGPGVPRRYLPLPAPLHPLLDPIPAVLAFYPFVEALARTRGLDPDLPHGSHKATNSI